MLDFRRPFVSSNAFLPGKIGHRYILPICGSGIGGPICFEEGREKDKVSTHSDLGLSQTAPQTKLEYGVVIKLDSGWLK